MEYILTPAVIVVGIGRYLGAAFGTAHSCEPLWWLLAYGVFVALNIWGVEMTFHVSVAVTLAALSIPAVDVLYLCARSARSRHRWPGVFAPRAP